MIAYSKRNFCHVCATAILLSAIGLLGVITASPASAASLPVRACSADVAVGSAPNEIWQLVSPIEGLDAVDRCPDGIVLGDSQTLSYNDWSAWQWMPVRSVGIDRVEFTISGGDNSTGVSYEYAGSCASCGSSFTNLPTRTAESGPVTITVEQPEINGISFRAICRQQTCPPSRELVLSDFTFTTHDDDPPDFSGLVGDKNVAYYDASQTIWTDGVAFPIDVMAYDYGFGLLAADATISDPFGDKSLWHAQPVCNMTDLQHLNTTALCDTEARYNWRADFRDLAQGVHDLTLNATDAVGNAAIGKVFKIGIDSVAPDAPGHLSWTSDVNPDGWTSDPGVALSWTPPAELADPGQVAPIDRVEYSVRKIDSLPVTSSILWGQATSTPQIVLPSEGLWRVSVWYVDQAGNVGEKAYKDIGYDYDAPDPPTLTANDWVSGDALLHGYSQRWAAPPPMPQLESGICGYAVLTDDRSDTVPPVRIDAPKDATGYKLPADLGEGFHFVHVRAVSCADRGSSTSTTELNVDATAPHVELVGEPLAAWSQVPVALTIMPSDQLSGVAGVHYSLDGGPEQTESAAVSLTIGEGIHTLTYAATDLAGNRSPSATRVIAVDQSAPSVAFDPQDPADPRKVTAVVRDDLSGLAQAQIEYRRIDAQATAAERSWQSLGAPAVPTAGELHELRIERVIPDEQLPAGRYELRVAASDLAGNVAASDSAANSDTRRVNLPIRRSIDLSAAIANVRTVCVTATHHRCSSLAACPKKERCHLQKTVLRDLAAPSTVRAFDDEEVLVGEALDANGNPLAGIPVAVFSAPLYRTEMRVGDAVTDSLGRYAIPIAAGPTRTFAVSFDGTAQQLPVTAKATLSVRARASLKLSRTRVHSGELLRFSGRLASADAWLPQDGKRVELQFLTPNGWSPTIAAPQTDETGRFTASYKWPNISHTTSFLFRVHVPAGEPWPFASGNSKAVRVRVFR